MGAELKIFEQNADFSSGKIVITLKEITTVCDNKLIEDLEGRSYEFWHLEGECGAIFELTGEVINEFLPRLQQFDKTLDENTFYKEDFYRLELSY